MSISDMIVVMKDGVLNQVGKPQDVYDDPENLFVASFLGTPAVNVFEGYVKAGGLYINDEKILNVGGGKYFIGSALILKGGEGGLNTLTGDEYEEAKKEFENHLVTLVCDGQEFSALELL